MIRTKPDKLPTGRGFSWGRRTQGGEILWRLFRRDSRGAIHQHHIVIGESAQASVAAHQLRIARRHLKAQVDGIDLKAMGVTP